MRPLELLLVLLLALRAAALPWLTTTRARLLAVAAVGLAVLQAGLEGWRWQLAPATLLVALVAVWGLRAPRRPDASTRTSPVVLGQLLLCGLAAVLGWGLPVFTDPPPTGRFLVGRVKFTVTSRHQPDPVVADVARPRTLLVLAWYPAEPARGASPEPFWPDAPVTAPEMAALLRLPRMNALGHLRYVASHTYPEAPLASSLPHYPVLVFSPGYGSGPWQNTVLAEELASHGFVVFAVGHPGESGALRYPDGRIVTPARERIDRMRRGGAAADALADDSLRLWVDDTADVVDALQELGDGHGEGATTRFAHRLDMSRLGVLGMSFGGTTAVEFCHRDERCAAALNLDGRIRGAALAEPLDMPMLQFLRAGNTANDAVFGRARGDRFRVEVTGATHLDFSDAGLVAPILRLGGVLGPVGGARMARIVNAYVLAFFDRYLRDGRWPLLFTAPSRAGYPEVMLGARRAPLVPPGAVPPIERRTRILPSR